MDVQSAANLNIPEGSVRNIHDKDKRLLWSAVGYNVRYDGDTTQQTYTGKNLLHIPSGDYTSNGIIWSRSGNSVNGSGSFSGQTWSVFINSVTLSSPLPAATYTLSIKDPIPSPYRLEFSAWDENNVRLNYTILSGQTYVTFTRSSSIVRISVGIAGGTIGASVSLNISDIQLEASSSPTTFEPYVGGIPAPNPDYPQDINVVKGEQTILASGKNLFLIPETETKNGVTLTKNSDGTFNLSGTATATATFNIKLDAMIESGTYTLSKSGGNFIAVVQDYLNTSWLSQLITLNYDVNSVTTSINPVGNRVSFVIQARNGVTYNLQNVKVQLEKNSSATQFEVHQNKIVNFDLRGKNLLYMPDGTNVSQNITWVVSDGVATGNGTTTSTFTGVTTFTPNSPLPAGTYTFSRPEASRYVLEFSHNDSNGNTYNGANYRIPSNQTSKTFTITHDIAKITVALLRDPNDSNLGTLTNFSFRAQLEIGNVATTYQPYHAPIELCKIGNYQDYIFKSSGKNLVDAIDSTWQTNNMTLTKTDGIFRMTAASGKIARAVLPLTGLIEGETYTISFDALGVSVSSNNLTYFRIREESSGGGWIGDGVGINVSSGYVRYSTTFVATSVSDPWAWFYLSASASNTNNVDIYVKNIQLEKGSYATPYEPYGTDWYVHKETGKTTFDGTETWSGGSYAAASPDCIYVYTDILDSVLGEHTVYLDAKCNYFTNAGKLLLNSTTDNISEVSIGAVSTSRVRFFVKDSSVTSKATWQTWLSTHETSIYYPIYTPTDTKITDTTITSQLDAIHDWLTRYDYYGNVTGNLPMIINRTGLT